MKASAPVAEPPVADTPAELDPESLAAIRNLMTEQEPAAPAAATVAETAAAPDAAAAVAPPPPASRKSDAFPQIAPQEAQAEPTQRVQQAATKVKAQRLSIRDRLQARIDDTKAQVTGYRPTKKHIMIAALALVVILRPWLIVGLIFLALFIFTAVFLILGYDGFWKRAMGLGRWYARRRPERSAELHRKLDTFAVKWDAILDRFPEGSVDGLYLPDFGELAEADARHAAAMERRLDSLRDTEANA